MKYNLCSACMFFQPSLKDLETITPRSCLFPALRDFFSPSSGGFPVGIDVIHCDYFSQYPFFYGDSFITDDSIHGVAFIRPKERPDANNRFIKLSDNSHNLKYIKNETKS